MTVPALCDSCGDETELVEVLRLYVIPEAWDTEGGVTEGGHEWWCAVCRIHYAHVMVDADTA